jgi:hypothetical protein
MRKMQSFGLGLVWMTLVVLFSSANPAWGQDVTATITGTVSDPSGAPIVGASVVAHDTERGTTWSSPTNESGVYNLIRVPIATYDLKVEAKGFQTAVHAPFTLVLNQTARIDVQMKMGAVTETIDVTGAPPLLQTESTEVSTLIDANTITSVALASRNYLQLTLLTPGATNVDPDGMRQPQSMLDSGRPYINGNREQANEYLLDGQLNSEDKNNETGYQPGVDAIQEFNLITQNASAEFGNYEGGVISATIKSGTNSFHGDLFEFLRNDKFDSNNASASWTRGQSGGGLGVAADGTLLKSELRYNQFGGTIGGPIIKNKLFFFADYQGQRFVTAGPTGIQLMTAKTRAGDFSQLGFQIYDPRNPHSSTNAGTPIPNNNLAAYIASGGGGQPLNGLPALAESAFATNLFGNKGYPLPQVDSLSGNNDFFSTGHALNNDQGDLKIDYYLSTKDHLSGRWSQMDLKLVPETGLPFSAIGDGGLIRGGSDEPVTNAVLNWTHTFGANLLNEVRFGFNKVRFTQNSTPTTSLGNISEQLGITGANLQSPGLMLINISGNNGANASIGQQNIKQVFHDAQIQAEDNVAITHGHHTTRTGLQYVRLRQNYIYPGNNGVLGLLNVNSLTGSGLADFWLGNIGGGSNRDTGGANTLDQLRGNVLGAYVQDDWRLTSRLTLNLGLRFEDHTPLYEDQNRVVNFNLMTGAIELPGQGGNNRALYNNYLGRGDWMPRVGFAWSPSMLGGKTVIRGGYAISSFTEGGGGNEELTQNPPFGIIQQSAPTGIGAISQGFGPAATCPTINLSCYAGQRIRIFDQNFMPALTQQWNLTIQHQLSNSLTFQIGYVGQHGTHLLNFEDVAQLEGLNASGQVAKPGQLIASRVPGPYLGGGTAGSLYSLDNPTLGGKQALAGTNMSNASQRYDALQAVLQKRMSNGLQAQVAYTYSKCLSDSPGYYGTGWGSTNAQSSGGQPGWENIYNKRADWGPCYFDQTHILSSYVTYQLPVGRGKQFGKDMNPVLNAVVGNWEIGGIVSFHTGNALTLNEFGGWGVGGDTSHTNGIEPYTLSGRPNCSGAISIVNKFVPGGTTSNPGPGFIQWLDPSSVSNPAPNTFGTCGVGNVRGPHYSNTDLSLHKDFLFTEKKRLEFRFEALNAFNHPVYTFSGGPANGSFDPGTPVIGPNPSNPSFQAGNPNFGHLTGSQGARQLQLALKFFF